MSTRYGASQYRRAIGIRLYQSEKLEGDAIPKLRRKIDYNTVGHSLLAEIDVMELCGSFGTKIDTPVRHLLDLQVTDPGAKCTVFSAWEDSPHSTRYSFDTTTPL